MLKDHLNQLSLIDQVKAIDPNIAYTYVLRAYSWPTALLQRAGYFMEVGGTIGPALEYAQKHLLKLPAPTKGEMMDFIAAQTKELAGHIVANAYRDPVFAKTGIHIVDLTDPFTWTQTDAIHRQQLIQDLAAIARHTEQKSTILLGNVMDANNTFVGKCLIDLNQTLHKLTGINRLRQ